MTIKPKQKYCQKTFKNPQIDYENYYYIWVNIDIYDGPVGVAVSGGADSALLCYILMKYATGPIHAINYCAKKHQRVATKTAVEIIGFCIDHTGFKSEDVILHTHFMEERLPHVMTNIVKNTLEKKELSTVYVGITAAPPAVVLESFKVQTTEFISQTRDPNEARPTVGVVGSYKPFINVDKMKIKEMYDELGLTESLFPITRSCDNPKVAVGNCGGNCWWCEERKWAFGTYE